MEVKGVISDLVPGESGVHLTIFRRNSKSIKSWFSCHFIVVYHITTAGVPCAKLHSDSWTPGRDFKKCNFQSCFTDYFFHIAPQVIAMGLTYVSIDPCKGSETVLCRHMASHASKIHLYACGC